MSDVRLPPRAPADGALVDRLREQLVDRVGAEGIAGPRRHRPEIRGYDVAHVLGEGGMGEVWAARDPSGRLVALKVMKRSLSLDGHGHRRFLREAHALADLHHPGIVEIYDVGVTADERPFLTMELLEGTTLAEYISARAPLSWEEAYPVLSQAADALVAAHARGVVHRDLKPSNIMLVGPRSRVRLIDFGLARHSTTSPGHASYTMTGQMMGTPGYMSPEQLRGERADARSDVYSLGCVAYEMLAGRRPFGTGTPEELLFRHLMQPVPRPELRRVPPVLRPTVEAIVLRSLRKRRENRFSSMAALREAIDGVGSGRAPVDVPSEGTWNVEPAGVPPRRSPAPLVIAVLGVGVGVGGWLVGPRLPSSSDGSDAETSASRSLPTVEPPTPPAEHASRVPLADIAAGVGFVCGLSEEQEVRCWGSDSRGRLGRGSNGSNVGDNELPAAAPPLELPPDRPVARLHSGADARHACVRFVDGGLRCWGYNAEGQLGLGTIDLWGDEPHETVRAAIDLPLGPVTDVVAGYRNTCALGVDGTAWCWGRGEHGIRGDGSTETVGDDESLDGGRLRPVALGGRRATKLALGRDHACALVDDGSVRCWGSNAKGQLGVPSWPFSIGDGVGNGEGRGERPDDPRLAAHGLDDVEVVDIAAGNHRSCAITSAGGVRCWGDDADGILGYDPATRPECSSADTCVVEVTPGDIDLKDAHVVALSLGTAHGCALDDGGTVWCWGSQIWGRVGDARSRELRTAATGAPSVALVGHPVDLGDGDGDGEIDRALQVVAGDEHTCARMATGGIRCWGRGESGRLGYGATDAIGDDETPAQYYERVGIDDLPVFHR